MSDRGAQRYRVLMRQLCGCVASSDEDPLSLEGHTVCGIVASVSNTSPVLHSLFEGLEILQNRGYDSAGICTLNAEQELVITKHASSTSTSNALALLEQEMGIHEGHFAGIAHTRWATHGPKTDINAHPHMDYKKRVALVHNGVIENASELRSRLETERGIRCVSQTDTEVIVQWIGALLDDGEDFVEACHRVHSMLQGTWGLAILHKDFPRLIVAARKGSPLLVGIGQGQIFLASEARAFSKYTNEVITLENGEVMVIDADKKFVDWSKIQTMPKDSVAVDKGTFPYWTIKEIMEQPESLSRALNYGGRFRDMSSVKLGGLDQNMESLSVIENLVICGCGTSLNAGNYGAKLMRRFGVFNTVSVFDAAEVTQETFPRDRPGLLVLTQSGETMDCLNALKAVGSLDVPCFSVTNGVGSTIARETRCGVYLNCGQEQAVAATKSFTSSVVVLALVTLWFAEVKQRKRSLRLAMIESVARAPTCVGMALQLADQIRELAADIQDRNSMFILGTGLAEPVAMESALKIKELCYMHVEGFPGGALKHGPFALIDDGFPVIIFILQDEKTTFMVKTANEIISRKAHVIVVTDLTDHQLRDEDRELFDSLSSRPTDLIRIPSLGPMTALIGAIPMQLLGYELCLLKGYDPDHPRNLAKVVSV